MQIRAGPRSILTIAIIALVIGATALGVPENLPTSPIADAPEPVIPAILEIPEITFEPVYVIATLTPTAEMKVGETRQYGSGPPSSAATPLHRSQLYTLNLNYEASVVPRSRGAPTSSLSAAVLRHHAHLTLGLPAGPVLRI